MPPEVDKTAFDAAFNQAYADTTAEENPASPAAAAPQEKVPEQAQNTPDELGEDGLFGEEFPDDGLDPNALAMKKNLQRVWTKKTQALAEQRRALEGLDPEMARTAALYQQAVQQDPRLALALLEQQAQQIRTVLGEAPGGSPGEIARPGAFADLGLTGEGGGALPEDMTPNEQYLWQQNQQLTNRLAQLETGYQGLERQSFETRAQQETRDLSERYGAKLTAFDQMRLGQAARAHGLSLTQAYLLENHDRLIAEAKRKATDEASAVVSRKALAAPPGAGLAGRAAPGSGSAPTTIAEAVAFAMRQHGIT